MVENAWWIDRVGQPVPGVRLRLVAVAGDRDRRGRGAPRPSSTRCSRGAPATSRPPCTGDHGRPRHTCSTSPTTCASSPNDSKACSPAGPPRSPRTTRTSSPPRATTTRCRCSRRCGRCAPPPPPGRPRHANRSRRPITYQHAERGELNAAEITRGPAHDAAAPPARRHARCGDQQRDAGKLDAGRRSVGFDRDPRPVDEGGAVVDRQPGDDAGDGTGQGGRALPERVERRRPEGDVRARGRRTSTNPAATNRPPSRSASSSENGPGTPGGGTGIPSCADTASSTIESHGLRSRGPHTTTAIRPSSRSTRCISRTARGGSSANINPSRHSTRS